MALLRKEDQIFRKTE